MKGLVAAVRIAGAALIIASVGVFVGVGSASAAAENDSSCATRPSTVPAYATCVVLDENTGNDPALHGETWAWVDTNNDLHVVAFPTASLSGDQPIQLCIRTGTPYPADFKCAGESADRVYVGSDLAVVIDLDAKGIAKGTPVYYSIHVNQGGRTTVSSGQGGIAPPPPPPGTSTTSAPVSSPAASVAATTAAAKPSTSVKAVKDVRPPKVLPKTGGGLPVGLTVAVSLGLLLGGAALIVLPRKLAVERGGQRRH